MAKEPGNSRNRARRIDVTSQLKTFRDRVGDGDRFDFFRFNLTNRSSFSLSLKGLKSNANVALLSARGRILQQARRPGRRNEVLNVTLEAGVYFVRVDSRQGNTRYRLQLSAQLVSTPGNPPPSGSTPPPNNPPGGSTPPPGGSNPTNNPIVPANTAPKLAVNSGLSMKRLGNGSIGGNSLQVTDSEQNAAQLTYKLTSLPKWGNLFLNGSLLGVNSTFTQDDLNNNRILYQNTLTAKFGNGATLTSAPQISGANVVWAASDGQDSEIFFYNNATGTVTQVTSNTVDDLKPQISGANLVWQSGTGNNAEVFFYDGNTGVSKQLSNNTSRQDINPRIDGSIVVWEEILSGDSDVRIYDHSSGSSSNIPGIQNDTNPFVSGTYVVFERRNSGNPATDGIYSYDLSLPTNNRVAVKVGNTDALAKLGGISGSTIVWEQQQQNPTERDVRYQTIGNSVQPVANSVNYDDYSPLISGSSIVFKRNQLASNTEDGIYFFNPNNANPLIRLSPNLTNTPLAISESGVVWQSSDGSDQEILFYNAATGTTTPLTNNTSNDSDASISGSNVVWQSGTQVFLYSSAAPNDSFNLQVTDGTATINTAFAITFTA